MKFQWVTFICVVLICNVLFIMIGITQCDFEQHLFPSNLNLVIFAVNQSPRLSHELGTSPEMGLVGQVLYCNINSIQFKNDDEYLKTIPVFCNKLRMESMK